MWCSASLINILKIFYIFNLMFENSVASVTPGGCSYFFVLQGAAGVLLWFRGFCSLWTIRTKLGRGCWLLLGTQKKLHKSEGLSRFCQKWNFPGLLKIHCCESCGAGSLMCTCCKGYGLFPPILLILRAFLHSSVEESCRITEHPTLI